MPVVKLGSSCGVLTGAPLSPPVYTGPKPGTYVGSSYNIFISADNTISIGDPDSAVTNRPITVTSAGVATFPDYGGNSITFTFTTDKITYFLSTFTKA